MAYLEQELLEIKQVQAEILKLLTAKKVEDKEIIYDQADLLRLLKVSRRTLSTWRATGCIEFSQAAHKIYYTKKM